MTVFPETRIDDRTLVVTLKPGTNLHVRNGALVWMDDGVDASVRMGSGVLGRLFSNNDLLFTEFANKAGDKPLRLVIGSSVPCKILEVTIEPGMSYVAHAGSFLACTGNVEQSGSISLKGAVLGTGGVMAKYRVSPTATKPGTLWLTAFGGLQTVTVKPGEAIRIDNGMFLCAEESVIKTWEWGKVGSIIGSIFNGEGLVFKVGGGAKGTTVHLHSQNLGDFAKALVPYLQPYFSKK